MGVRLVIEIALFGFATAGLAATGHRTWGMVLFVLALVTSLLNASEERRSGAAQ
jgi:hypothetical protein